jgi:hypothetical protein
MIYSLAAYSRCHKSKVLPLVGLLTSNQVRVVWEARGVREGPDICLTSHDVTYASSEHPASRANGVSARRRLNFLQNYGACPRLHGSTEATNFQ